MVGTEKKIHKLQINFDGPTRKAIHNSHCVVARSVKRLVLHVKGFCSAAPNVLLCLSGPSLTRVSRSLFIQPSLTGNKWKPTPWQQDNLITFLKLILQLVNQVHEFSSPPSLFLPPRWPSLVLWWLLVFHWVSYLSSGRLGVAWSTLNTRNASHTSAPLPWAMSKKQW